MLQEKKEAFLSQDIFHSVSRISKEHIEQFLNNPYLFETYLFTPEGIQTICAMQSYADVEQNEMLARDPCYVRLLKKTGEELCGTYMKNLSVLKLTPEEIQECVTHYRQHRTEFTVPFVGWDRLEELKTDPHFEAHQLLTLFGMYEHNFKHPLLLEGLAAISFDPLNRAVIEDHLLDQCGRRYLEAIWLEVNNYLTKE